MDHLSSIVDSDDSSEFEGFTSADISEANRKWNKTNSFVDNDSFSDSDSDINEPESEIFSGSSGQGNYSTSSSEENYSISSESSPLDENDIENNYPLDDGSNELDIDDIVDTDNILQNNGEANDMIEILNKPITWTSTFRKVYTNPFTHPSGPKLPAEFDVAKATPINYFRLFFTDEVFQKICTNTNLYHEHQVNIKRTREPNYTDKYWADIEINQLKCYFGMSIIMGLNKLGRYQQYWSSDPFIGNEGIKKCMPIREYERIQSSLHVSK